MEVYPKKNEENESELDSMNEGETDQKHNSHHNHPHNSHNEPVSVNVEVNL